MAYCSIMHHECLINAIKIAEMASTFPAFALLDIKGKFLLYTHQFLHTIGFTTKPDSIFDITNFENRLKNDWDSLIKEGEIVSNFVHDSLPIQLNHYLFKESSLITAVFLELQSVAGTSAGSPSYQEAKDKFQFLEQLTPSEEQTFKYLIKMFGYKKIAKITFHAESTIKKHAASIYKKCGVRNKKQFLELFSNLTGHYSCQ